MLLQGKQSVTRPVMRQGKRVGQSWEVILCLCRGTTVVTSVFVDLCMPLYIRDHRYTGPVKVKDIRVLGNRKGMRGKDRLLRHEFCGLRRESWLFLVSPPFSHSLFLSSPLFVVY